MTLTNRTPRLRAPSSALFCVERQCGQIQHIVHRRPGTTKSFRVTKYVKITAKDGKDLVKSLAKRARALVQAVKKAAVFLCETTIIFDFTKAGC